MTKPPGKLLPLVAALLCGAVLAQAAKPSDHSITSAAPAVQAASAHGPLSPPITAQAAHVAAGRGRPRQPSQRSITPHDRAGRLEPDRARQGPLPDLRRRAAARVDAEGAAGPAQAQGARRRSSCSAVRRPQLPDLVALERAAGHHVGNHTWDHKTLTQLPAAKMRQEIAVRRAIEVLPPAVPGHERQVAAIAAAYHQRQVLWDVDTQDWTKPGTAKIEHAILQRRPPRRDHPDARRRRQPLRNRRRPRQRPDQTDQARATPTKPCPASCSATDAGGASGEVLEGLVDDVDRLVERLDQVQTGRRAADWA